MLTVPVYFNTQDQLNTLQWYD